MGAFIQTAIHPQKRSHLPHIRPTEKLRGKQKLMEPQSLQDLRMIFYLHEFYCLNDLLNKKVNDSKHQTDLSPRSFSYLLCAEAGWGGFFLPINAEPILISLLAGSFWPSCILLHISGILQEQTKATLVNI